MKSELELCIDTLEVENKMLRARNERMENELDTATTMLFDAKQDLKKLVKAYRELIIKHDRLEAKHQK